MTPDVVRLLVREVARSPQLQQHTEEFERAFSVLERIVVRGQEEGSFRPEVDARLAAWVTYGALEEILTGWVLCQLPDSAADVAAAERAVVDILTGGLVAGADRTPGSSNHFPR